ncbi:MAG: helix-turn-helix domain-containing protein [bacterium]
MPKARGLFRKKLRSFREAAAMSQRELSEKCGYTRSYVGQIERGEKDPSFESMIRLADALNLSILDFFRNDHEDLTVELSEALTEMTEFSEATIRSMSTLP